MSSEIGICDILQVLMAKHCHGSKDIPRDALCQFASSGGDRDEQAAVLDSAVARLNCVEERPNERYALRQTEELVDFLVDECGRNPAFFKVHLNHVPPDVWRKYGVTPPRP